MLLKIKCVLYYFLRNLDLKQLFEDFNLYLLKKKDVDFIDIKKHLFTSSSMKYTYEYESEIQDETSTIYSISQHHKPCRMSDVEQWLAI